MSEIDEMKTLVTDTLEKNGTLGQFKAQLRSSIITVLQSQDKELFKKDRMPNETPEGTLMLELIQEFMTNYNLKYTSSVFGPEAGCPSTCRTRSQLSKDLGLDENTNAPLLMQLLSRRHSGPPLSPQFGTHTEQTSTRPQNSYSPSERPGHGISRASKAPDEDDDYNFTSFQKPTLTDYTFESPQSTKQVDNYEIDDGDGYNDDFDKAETPVKQTLSPTANALLDEARSDDSLAFEDKSATESEIEGLKNAYNYVEQFEDRIERDSDDEF